MSGRHAFYTNDAPVIDPDNAWLHKNAAEHAMQALRDRDGKTAYLAWIWRTFEQDENTLADFSWRQIAAAALNELHHPTECGCVLDNQSCPVCRSYAHVMGVTPTE